MEAASSATVVHAEVQPRPTGCRSRAKRGGSDADQVLCGQRCRVSCRRSRRVLLTGLTAASTASVKVNGVEAVRTDHVTCSKVQWLLMIDIADKTRGAQVVAR